MSSLVFKTESEATLQALCRRSLNDEATGFRLLSGGMFNTTYVVDTRKNGKVVLRLGAVNRHLLMPFEQHLMEAEAEVYRRCREVGIPVQDVLALDLSRTVVDRDYMIVRYLEGIPMSEADLDPDSYQKICATIGAEVAKLHSLSAARFGRIADVLHGAGYETWREAMEGELSDWETVGVPARVLEPEDLRRIHRAFEAIGPLLDEIRTPSLVHNDLWKGNMLISKTDGTWRLWAILDADRAIYADPDLEFSGCRIIHDEPAFRAAYGRVLSQSPEARLRRGLYHLITRMWHAYVFQNEYLMDPQYRETVRIIRRQLDDLEKNLE